MTNGLLSGKALLRITGYLREPSDILGAWGTSSFSDIFRWHLAGLKELANFQKELNFRISQPSPGPPEFFNISHWLTDRVPMQLNPSRFNNNNKKLTIRIYCIPGSVLSFPRGYYVESKCLFPLKRQGDYCGLNVSCPPKFLCWNPKP